MNRQQFHCIASLLSAQPQEQAISVVGAADIEPLLQWLDFAGLSLYLLASAEDAGFTERLPARLVDELLLRRSQNTERSRLMLAELRKILAILKEAGIPVVVMKGFSLSGTLSPHPFARHQNDLDLLMSPASHRSAIECMTRAGYTPHHRSNDLELTFLSPATSRATDPSAPAIYRACPHAKIEFHYQLWDSMDDVQLSLDCNPLDSSTSVNVDGMEIPALSLPNMFTLHVMHAFRHLIYTGWIRPSWLFEIAYGIRRHFGNDVLWLDFSTALTSHRTRQAAGLVLAVVEQYFKAQLPVPLGKLSDSIPRHHRVWLELCGDAFLFSRIAESKLNLLIFADFCASESSAAQHEEEAIGFVSKYLRAGALPASYKDMPIARWVPYIGKRIYEHMALNLEVSRYRRAYLRALLRSSPPVAQ